MRNRQRRNRGITLVEIMIALVASSFVIAGAFGLLAAQRPMFRRQRELQDRQQNLWVAMEFIQRDYRKAGMGFGACTTPASLAGGVNYRSEVLYFPSAGGQLFSGKAISMTDGGTGGSDSLTIVYFTPPGTGSLDAQPTGTITWANNTSAPTVVPNPMTVTDARNFMTPGACTCPGTCAAVTATQYALIFSSGLPCTLVEVTNETCSAGPAGTLTLNTTLALGGTPPPYVLGGFAYPATSATQFMKLGTLTFMTYSIDTATDPAVPMLVRSINNAAPEIIAYGIEDMQVVPSCDINRNGAIEPEGTGGGMTSDEWFFNTAGDTVPATCTTFPQARVTLVARTSSADPGFTMGQRPAVDNRTAGGADQFHRRMLGAVVMAPNLAL